MPFRPEDVGPLALSIGMGIIIIALVATILPGFLPATYTSTAVTNETINSSGSVPETLTTTNREGGISGVVIYTKNTEYGDTIKLLPAANYTILSSTAGTINVTAATDMNSTNDQYNVSYTYQAYGNATEVVHTGTGAIVDFADWFAIIVIVVVSVIIIGVVLMLQRAGGGRA